MLDTIEDKEDKKMTFDIKSGLVGLLPLPCGGFRSIEIDGDGKLIKDEYCPPAIRIKF